MKKTPIFERIDKALGPAPMGFRSLARAVFPDDDSWRYQSNGGPPGCFMALSAALRRGGYRTDGSGCTRIIYPRRAS